MPELEIQPFSDDHLEPAAELLSERHRRHRETEPLLPELSDPLAAVEADWRADDASGVFASRGGEPVGYLIAAPAAMAGTSWMRVWIGGQAIRGDREPMRDLYAAAAQRWVDEGHTRHAVFAPSHDAELVDAWFRLSFGASAIFAIRETGAEEGFDGGVTIRPGTPDDFPDAARLEIAMSESMVPAPSFSGIVTQSHDEVLAEWREDGDSDDYEFSCRGARWAHRRSARSSTTGRCDPARARGLARPERAAFRRSRRPARGARLGCWARPDRRRLRVGPTSRATRSPSTTGARRTCSRRASGRRVGSAGPSSGSTARSLDPPAAGVRLEARPRRSR